MVKSKVEQDIIDALEARAAEHGIDIVDVRMKRVDFTPEISESVYRRMEAERKRVASEERSKGAAQAERIRANADRTATLRRSRAKAMPRPPASTPKPSATTPSSRAFTARSKPTSRALPIRAT